MAATLLKGTAFLTGAGSGIGRAAALALAKNGITRLVLTDRNPSSLNTVSQEIKSLASQLPTKNQNIEIEQITLDVSDTEAVERSFERAKKTFGRIDVAVNVAGIGGNGEPTDRMSEENWGSVLDVNLSGVWRCQRAEIRGMLGQEDLGYRKGRGNIINISSMYGLIGTPPSIAATQYVASKHGVIGLTKADAIHYASRGIRINAICPGYIETPLLGESPGSSKGMEPEIAKTPMQRLGRPEEVADCVVFLAGEQSSFVCGAALVCDGGYTAN